MSTAQTVVACYLAASAAFGAVWAAVGLRRPRTVRQAAPADIAPPTAAERPPSPDVAARQWDAIRACHALPDYATPPHERNPR